MKATELLKHLTSRGIRLESRGDRLWCWPRSDVTPELAEQVVAVKGELLEILRAEPTPPPAVDEYSWIDEAFQPDVTALFDICPCRSHRDYWVSVYGGHLTCGGCHPPVDESIVSKWIHLDEKGPGILEKVSISRATRNGHYEFHGNRNPRE